MQCCRANHCHQWVIGFLIWFLAIAAHGLGLGAEETVPRLPTNVLILKHNAVMEGKVRETNDGFFVAQPRGGEVFVPLSEVRLQCVDLKDAYLQMKDALPEKRTARAHMELARWCVTYQLWTEARAEFRSALELEPNRDEARVALDRVDRLIANPPGKLKTSSEQSLKKLRSSDAQSRDAESLGGLSRELAAQFARQIQPILVNNCGIAACHGPKADNEFRLETVRITQVSNRLLVERNLGTVLRYIDLQEPAESPLLRIPKAGHGQRGRSPLQGAREREQSQKLLKWVRALAEEKTGVTPAEISESGVGNLSGASSPETAANSSNARVSDPPIKDPFGTLAEVGTPADGGPITKVSATKKEPGSPAAQANAKPVSPDTKSKRLAKPTESAPVPMDAEPDPFDPEIFNRETRKRQSVR